MSRPGPAPRGTFLHCAGDNAAAGAGAFNRRGESARENRESAREEKESAPENRESTREEEE